MLLLRHPAWLPAPQNVWRQVSSFTAHLGQLSLTVRPNRSPHRLGTSTHRSHVGSVRVGLLALSWLRRPTGSRRWGVERQHRRPGR
jgi:hypothetical protein